ncbi:MAG TPA: chemotaxis protein CheB, partial [Cytophagales bacterium]|nr:chemotaxis protein CheB [Cytophagales bacterium]
MKTEEFQETNILSTTPQGADYYIAGIGFSAGGLEPLTRFFDHTPHDSVAYVIIQHLPLDFKSRMAELLSKHSKLKIHEIVNHMRV